jgi:hypothetical protein
MVSYAHVPGVIEKIGSGRESRGIGLLSVLLMDAILKFDEERKRDDGMKANGQARATE